MNKNKKHIYFFIFFITFFLNVNGIFALTCNYNQTESTQNSDVKNIKIEANTNTDFKVYEDSKLICNGASDTNCSVSHVVANIISNNKCTEYLSRTRQAEFVSYSLGSSTIHNYIISTAKEESCSYLSVVNGKDLISVTCINNDCTLKGTNTKVLGDDSCSSYSYLNVVDGKYELTNSSLSTHMIYKDYKKMAGTVSCYRINNIPARLPKITSSIVNIIKIIVPIMLIVIGMIDITKAITSQKEDEIKKGQKIFIKRLSVALLLFFVIVIVEMVIGLVAGSEGSSIIDCMNCFLNNNCQ